MRYGPCNKRLGAKAWSFGPAKSSENSKSLQCTAVSAQVQVSGWSRRGRLARALSVLVDHVIPGTTAGFCAGFNIVRFEFAPVGF